MLWAAWLWVCLSVLNEWRPLCVVVANSYENMPGREQRPMHVDGSGEPGAKAGGKSS